MTDQDSSPHIAALQELQAALDAHRRTQEPAGARPAVPGGGSLIRALLGLREWGLRAPGWRLPFNPWFMFDRRHPVVRMASFVAGGLVLLVAVGVGALWWRLNSGPIMLDIATPWLTAAIEQNLGSRYRVEVGGTQIERDAQGHTALRLRDIVLRDASGDKVAVAPKAEVGISGSSLLMASPRAESFRLVDANMTIRIDPDGRINVLVGGDKPFVSVAPDQRRAFGPAASNGECDAARRSTAGGTRPPARPRASKFSLQAISERGLANNVAALLAWIDEVNKLSLDSGTGGFDGQALNDIGITNASLIIDDRRGGSEWKFTQISLTLNRPKAGGVALTVLSESKERPWVVGAALTPSPQGHRRLQFEARKVVLDDLLALRMSESKIRSDTQISASIDSDITADGTPETISGSIYAEGGSIGNPEEPDSRIPITSAEFGLDWSAQRRTLRVPFKVTAGAARYTLRAEFAAPAQAGGAWPFAVGGGWVVLDPINADDEGLVLKRVVMRGNIDPAQQRITLEQGDLGTKDLGSAGGVTVAMSGRLDYAGEPRLALGIACNPMPASAMKRLWPAFISPKVRDWVIEHIVSGNVERIDIATNATFPQMQTGGPPMPEEGLSIEMVGSNATLKPVEGLPSIHDADMTLRMNGRTAKITLGKGIVDVSAGAAPDRLQRRVRRAEYPHQAAAGPRQLPRRRHGAGRGGAADVRPAARFLQPAVRPGDDPRQYRGAGAARHAAPPRSAARLDRLRHHRRSDEFQRRQDAARPEGRGAVAAGDRQQPTLRDQGRRQSRRRSGPGRVPQAEGRDRRRGQADRHARRGGADAGRSRCRPRARRTDAGEGQRPYRRRRSRGPLQRRGRSHQHQDRERAAGLDQAARQIGTAGVHAGQAEGRRAQDRRYPDRRPGRAGQGQCRARQRRRAADGELPGVRHLRRRQGHGARRSRRPTARCGW